jgi:predicted RNA binding protein YcfA (HicA-like mRNA interferase family)
VSGREALRRFQRAGWRLARIHGSHAVLTKADTPVNLAIPLHDELGKGILRKLIRLSGLTVAEFQAQGTAISNSK